MQSVNRIRIRIPFTKLRTLHRGTSLLLGIANGSIIMLVSHVRKSVSTLSETLGTVKTVERALLVMDRGDVSLQFSEVGEAVRAGSRL